MSDNLIEELLARNKEHFDLLLSETNEKIRLKIKPFFDDLLAGKFDSTNISEIVQIIITQLFIASAVFTERAIANYHELLLKHLHQK
ncbi:MAG: hypothetical protein QMD10_12430 [Desulfitobacteriaceae bacterium]|nr:hypothetical protein [Desulfitobacteriaceae bacterium]